ncbi:MAG: selenium-dependent molybdenum cofactor biosynthesis protein YqeB [Fusicatenibacter sp.]
MNQKLIIVRGGGDLATGTIHRLWSAGLPVLVLETEHPAAIRRQVSVCEAVYDGQTVIENMMGIRIWKCEEAFQVIKEGKVPVMVDPKGESIRTLRPDVVVDAILAKKNLGTSRDMAPFTVALGPGFEAGKDVDVVIETKRGHNLGRVIRKGSAFPNTGIPGNIGGYAAERVIHSLNPGIFHNICKIGDIVTEGEEIAWIEQMDGNRCPVNATITGILRGLLREGYPIPKGFKIADIDPRKEELENCFTISDKARCIAGSVLEVVIPYIYR